MGADITALLLTLKLALISSLLLLFLATPLAWWLSRWQSAFKPVVQAVIALPLVLPPTVLGFYLLVAFSPDNAFGQLWVSMTGETLAFTFTGLIVGSVFYSLPFAVQPLYAGFSQLQHGVLKEARLLHFSRWAMLTRIVIPLCKTAFVVAFGLSFAHTLGEFGVVLMIGGNIPGETKVLSIALFDYVETLQYGRAHQLAAGLLLCSFVLLLMLYRYKPLNRGSND